MSIFSVYYMVPGHRQSMIIESLTSGADALVWDIADVPNIYRSVAREMIQESLRDHVKDEKIFIRINHPKLNMLNYDLSLLSEKVDGIIIPVVENPEEVIEVVKELEKMYINSPIFLKTKILVTIGSALGVYNVKKISGINKKIDALVFDARTFCSQTGISPGKEGNELIYARSRLMLAATLAGVSVIDSSITLTKKEDLIKECVQARRMGFKSKVTIDPCQIPIIQSVFKLCDIPQP